MTSLNGVRKRRLTAKETSIACEVLDEKNIASLFKEFFVGIIIKATGAIVLNRLVICLRFL